MKFCVYCGNSFELVTPWQKYCSSECHRKNAWKIQKQSRPERIRYCRTCGTRFPVETRADANRQHCSQNCAAQTARESRRQFYLRHPERNAQYRAATKRKTIAQGNYFRLLKRFPDIPKHCQFCGESRVLDVAHKPQHARNGAYRSAANCTPEKVWILCPTCHALIDRCGYDPALMGLF